MVNEQIKWMAADTSGSASSFVINQIREALINKQLNPGDKLPSEVDLATSMHVSRSTIREAIKVLTAYGVVEVRRGNGTFICQNDDGMSMDSMLFSFLLSQPSPKELREFRAYMEQIVMELAVRNATEDDIRELEDSYSELVEVCNDSEKSSKNELEFHRILGRISGNRLVSRIYMFSISFFSSSIASTHKNFGGSAALRIHRMTIDIIKNRDFTSIDKLIDENIKTWMKNADSRFFS